MAGRFENQSLKEKKIRGWGRGKDINGGHHKQEKEKFLFFFFLFNARLYGIVDYGNGANIDNDKESAIY
jgi:hypothetical protein